MKRTIQTLIAVAMAMVMTACASPRNATIEDGKVTNITSAEAVTLVKQDVRRKKVEDVQKNAKPLLRLEAHAGQAITINAKVFEVNAPQDIRELLAEQDDSVSENVQMVREYRGAAREVLVPVALGKFAADVAKRKSDNAKIVSLDANATRRAESAAQAGLVSDLVEAATEKPDYFLLPAGAVPAPQ